MPGENIIDLEGMLQPYIGPNKKIVDVKKERLTAPGENYCSIMLKLDITLKNLETGKEEELNAVAKTINTEVNEFFRTAAPPQFKKEIAFYTEIVPALQEFQREQGITEVIDLFPKLYAARKNLHGKDDEVDDDCVIILENLKVQGYTMIDRVIGFDLEGAKFVIKHLVQLHAVPIALKLKKPEVFEQKIKRHCLIRPFEPIPEGKMKDLKPPEWLDYVEKQEKCQPYLKPLYQALGNIDKDNFFARPHVEPFATFAHNDMWVNNTLHIEKGGSLLKTKFVDYQLYQYGSGICDLIHFTFVSCQNYVSRDHLDELLKYYYTNLVEILQKLGCDTEEFGYNAFLERVEIEAPAELVHCLYMAVPILGRKGEVSISVKSEDFSIEGAVTKEANGKIAHEVYEFGKRGWIK